MNPDLGNTLWDRGVGTTTPLVVRARWDVLTDYGDFREVSGVTYDHDLPHDEREGNPFAAYCVTVRTKQAEAAIVQMFERARDVPIVASCVLSSIIEQGRSGERYRVLIGTLGPAAPTPRATRQARRRAERQARKRQR